MRETPRHREKREASERWFRRSPSRPVASHDGAARKVRLSGRDVAKIRRVFPLVVANITAETIVELSAALATRVAPKGYLILSGILNARAQRVIDAMDVVGVVLLERKRERQWTSLLLRRK